MDEDDDDDAPLRALFNDPCLDDEGCVRDGAEALLGGLGNLALSNDSLTEDP